MAAEILKGIELNEERFIGLLTKLIGETEFLQNNPPALVPQEDRSCKHVLDVLKPFSKEEGGPLLVEKVTYVEGRSNITIQYPASKPTDKCISFVGSHLDVVPATPESWDRNPFELVIEGDKLYGRGTTDCLGHVAVVTTLFSQLAEAKPELDVNVHAVFIASEEAYGPGVGVDVLMEKGKLDALKNGPIIWVDCADSQPCIGTAGAITWHMKAVGKLFHSGLPHKGINALELAMDAVKYVQQRFYEDFPAHPQEEVYKFATPSTMKPTQMSCPKGGLNQLPPHTTISGDIRLTPFYEVDAVKKAVEGYVATINENLSLIEGRGPASKYTLPAENRDGRIELTWGESHFTGIACKLDSPGFKALCQATEDVVGKAEPYSICGSLPLVHEMQAGGFDIQLTGYGLQSTYHADNEYCQLSDMKNACKVLSRVIAYMNAT